MPQVDLAAALKPIADELLPGWTVTCEAVPAEEMAGALATCSPIPTRSMAHVRVVTPWPANESLQATLCHELVHGALSPLTSLLGNEPGAIMVEEQIVERIGNLLAKIPRAARLAVARAIQMFAPVAMRARLSTAGAGRIRARTGEAMDPETIQKMIDALKAGDGESALKMCEEALVKAASGGAAPPPTAGEPDGDETAPAAKVDAGAGGGAPPGDASGAPQDTRLVARKGSNVETEDQKRARLAFEGQLAEMKAMTDAMRPAAKETLIVGLRARMGAGLTPAAEKLIMGAANFQKAQELASFAEAMGGGAQRARSGVEIESAIPDGAGAKTVPAADLAKEGFTQPWINTYEAAAKRDPGEGQAFLESGRGALRARVRQTQNGAAS